MGWEYLMSIENVAIFAKMWLNQKSIASGFFHKIISGFKYTAEIENWEPFLSFIRHETWAIKCFLSFQSEVAPHLYLMRLPEWISYRLKWFLSDFFISKGFPGYYFYHPISLAEADGAVKKGKTTI